jgi:hypothetical protein
LDEAEFKLAVQCYPDLADQTGLHYLPRSATAGMNVGSDAYFDNEAILEQFERLFRMLKFKSAYTGHEIEVIVDNARTHTTKE